MTISFSSSRSNLKRTPCFSTATVKSTKWWSQGPTAPSWQLVRLRKPLVSSQGQVCYQCSISRAISLPSATCLIRKKSFTLFSVRCTANTSATWCLSARTNRASCPFAAYSRNYCKHTNLKCATTWTLSVSTHWRLPSAGCTMLSSMCLKSIRSSSFSIAFWALRLLKFCLFSLLVFSHSVPTSSLLVRARKSLTSCLLIWAR